MAVKFDVSLAIEHRVCVAIVIQRRFKLIRFVFDFIEFIVLFRFEISCQSLRPIWTC